MPTVQGGALVPVLPDSSTGISDLLIYSANNPSSVTAFESSLGRQVSGVMMYFNQSTVSAFASSATTIPTPVFTGGRKAIYSVPICTADSSLSAANTGTFDTTWTNCASTIIANYPNTRDKIYIRGPWELTLSTQPWYPGAGGTNAATLVSATQRMVNIFRGQSKRFRFVWGIYPGTGSDFDPAICYPGDAYVDVCDIDMYMDSVNNSLQQQGLNEIQFQETAGRGFAWLRGFAQTHGKAYSVTEFGNNSDANFRWNTGVVTNDGIYNTFITNPPIWCGQWIGLVSGISSNPLDGTNPNQAALFLKYFGTPQITTVSSFNKLASSTATITLNCIQNVTWTLISGPGYIYGNVWTLINGMASGTTTITVQATSRWAFSTKTITINWVSAYTFTNTEASNYIARWTAQPDEGRKQLIDNFIGSLKSAGVYSLAAGLYLRAVPTQQAALLNILSSSNTSVLEGTPAFIVDQGFVQQYSVNVGVDTGLPQNTAPFAQNSGAMVIWSTFNLRADFNAPAISVSGTTCDIIPRNASNQLSAAVNTATPTTVSQATGLGVFAANRSGAAATQFYFNGSQVATDTTASAATTANDFIEGNQDNWCIGFTGIFSSLTSGQVSSITTSIQAYADAIGAPR